MPEFKINLGLLEKQPIVMEGEADAAWLEVEPTSQLAIASPVKYSLTTMLVSGNVLTRGSLSYKIAGSCGRCLENVERDITVNNVTIMIDDPQNEELDIADDVREEALLALPLNVLCADDCAGLCPVCGVNLNRKQCNCAMPEKPADESPWSALDNLNLK